MSDVAPVGPGDRASAAHTLPLTSAVIAPGWALAYGVAVLALNLALQFASRSEAVMGPLRSLVSGVGGSDAARSLAAAGLAATIIAVSYLLMLLPAGVLVFTARRRGVSLASAVGVRPTSLGTTLRLAALIVVGGFAVTLLYAWVCAAFGVPVQGNTTGLVAGFGAGWPEMALAFILVGVVAPFVEEVTFRGIVFPSLQASWGTGAAMLASGAMFGIVHLQLTIAVPLALLGMALTAVFMRTRSLWSAIAAHCAYNVVSLALAFALLR